LVVTKMPTGSVLLIVVDSDADVETFDEVMLEDSMVEELGTSSF